MPQPGKNRLAGRPLTPVDTFATVRGTYEFNCRFAHNFFNLRVAESFGVSRRDKVVGCLCLKNATISHAGGRDNPDTFCGYVQTAR